MNRNPLSDDLGAALHGIADGVGTTPSAIGDDEFAATVRNRAHAMRRRRRNQHIGVITGCLALVAVGGVVVVQNLPGGGPTTLNVAAQATQNPLASLSRGTAPSCGGTAELPIGAQPLALLSPRQNDSEESTSGDLASSTTLQSEVFSIGDIHPLTLKNNSEETFAVASTGYADIVLVKDGVVVAMPKNDSEPIRSSTLQPGETAPITTKTPVACSDTPLAKGEYEAYVYLDAQVSTAGAPGDVAEKAVIYGGPWKINAGETTQSVKAKSQHCGEEISKVSRLSDAGLLDKKDVVLGGDSTTVTYGSNAEGARFETVVSYETYLFADGKIVASATPGEKIDLTTDIFGDMTIDTFATPSKSCGTEAPVKPGTYQMFSIMEILDEKTGEAMEVFISADDVTITG